MRRSLSTSLTLTLTFLPIFLVPFSVFRSAFDRPVGFVGMVSWLAGFRSEVAFLIDHVYIVSGTISIKFDGLETPYSLPSPWEFFRALTPIRPFPGKIGPPLPAPPNVKRRCSSLWGIDSA